MNSDSFETGHGRAPAIWTRPDNAIGMYVLAHGAGAGMQHSFMNAMAERLAEHRVATLRYEFLYMAAGGRRIDREPVLLDTVRAAVQHARTLAPDLTMIAGGKSMGGRMTSRAAANAPLDVHGLGFIGFPLHRPKRVSIDRAAHLDSVSLPMLFLQGTRDDLADMDSMTGVTDHLGARATLHVVEGADHGFHVLKRSGRTDDEVLEELAVTIADFIVGL